MAMLYTGSLQRKIRAGIYMCGNVTSGEMMMGGD